MYVPASAGTKTSGIMHEHTVLCAKKRKILAQNIKKCYLCSANKHKSVKI